MEIINGKSLSEMCDYSFGDHLGGLDPEHLPGGHMMPANAYNSDFLTRCEEFARKYVDGKEIPAKTMTLFIDNIRLYPRSIIADNENDARWVAYIMSNNNLLGLCSLLPHNKFVIFCSHEDTPIDDKINIPDNVLAIHAVNAEYFNEKIHPFPYGLQRPIERGDVPDLRLPIMKERVLEDKHAIPNKLLYVNCGIERHEERKPLAMFEGLDWVTCRFDKDSKFFPYDKYNNFLDELQNHKFMVCPKGHGLDCHRNWESLYLRRVPVMLKSPYFTRLMDGFPVLFIDKWSDITKELLEQNNHLFEQAQVMSLKKLDLDLIFKTIVQSYG